MSMNRYIYDKVNRLIKKYKTRDPIELIEALNINLVYLPDTKILLGMYHYIQRNRWGALSGSTSAVTAEQVAQAAVGAMENGKHRETFPINGYTLKHADFAQMMIDALGQTDKTQLHVVPYETLLPKYEEADRQTDAAGLEHGIHVVTSQKLSDMDIVTDPAQTMDKLGIEEQDVVQSIKDTLKHVVDSYKE